MLHHYLEFMDFEAVAEAEQVSAALTEEYQALESNSFNGYRRHPLLSRPNSRSMLAPTNVFGTDRTHDNFMQIESGRPPPILFPAF
jgi:hypothetical protein